MLTRRHVLSALLASPFAGCDLENSTETLEAEASALVEQGGAASVTLAAARGDKLLWRQSFGHADLGRRLAATPETPYSLASISKPITASAVMILAARGEVDLDRPVSGYLDGAALRLFPGHREPPTVRQVMSHTAGLPLHYQFFLEDEDFARPPMPETIRRYGFLAAPPGEEYEYSNLGYGVLEHLIESVSGRAYAEFLRTEIFEPLGMESSSAPASGAEEERSPRRWAVRYWNAETALPFYDFDHRGASAVFASAADLIRFGQLHCRETPRGAKAILPRKAIREMQQPLADRGGSSYGLGWAMEDRNGRRVVSHSGGMGGVSTSLLMIPEMKLVAVALANSRSAEVYSLAQKALWTFAAPQGRIEPASADEREQTDSLTAPPGKWLGRWEGSVSTYLEEIPLTVEIGREQSRAQLGDSPPEPLREIAFSEGKFSGRFSGDIGTPDANRRRYVLACALRRRGERLQGRVTAVGMPGPRLSNALSYWADLRYRGAVAPLEASAV